MRRLSNKLSIVILVLLFGALVIAPNTQAQSINRSVQGPDNAAYKAFADTLTTEQFKSIEQILQKYKAELEAVVAETGEPNIAAASAVFLPLVQGGDSQKAAGSPTISRNLAAEKLAKRFAEVQGQINGEIRAILTAEQASMFDAMFGSLSLPAESDSVQSAAAEINTTYCYYAYYYGYNYANYYSYYAYYYAYYAWYYGNSTYAYYAYYYGYYAYYYAYYYQYIYGYYCYYG
jgi:hypothetical protein